MSDRPREVLAEQLRGDLPATWRITVDESARDDPAGVTVQLQLQKVQPGTSIGGVRVWPLEYTATIRVPGEDLTKAEDLLDDELLEFIAALDKHGVQWGEFVKASYDGRLGYQATLTLYAERTA